MEAHNAQIMENQTGKTNRKVLNLAPELHGWLDLLEGALVGDVVACLSITMAVETTSPGNGEALVSRSLFCFGRLTCSAKWHGHILIMIVPLFFFLQVSKAT
jgi:hypothetical protein